MSPNSRSPESATRPGVAPSRFAHSYYGVLELHPAASPVAIRRAYRELSKRYHPDTTLLAPDVATVKFQRLNEAYATLSNPDRRSIYDLQIGYSRWNVIQVPRDQTVVKGTDGTEIFTNNSAYLDASDRPLSAGEIFALALLGLTLIGCLALALFVAWLRGDPLVVPGLLSSFIGFI